MENIVGQVIGNFATPAGLVALVTGVSIGFVIGVLPGLGQGMALILTLPMAFVLPPEIAFIIFASVLGSSLFGGSVTSIILNTPGTVGNMTTLLDGYPMARQGQAGRALGLAAGSSIAGGLIGVILVVICIPGVETLVMLYGAQEYFWTIILALVIIALATMGGAFLPGLVAGLVGLLLSFVGFSKMTWIAHYTGGSLYLWDGLQLVAFAVGCFALSELVILQAAGKSIAETRVKPATFLDTLKGAWEAIRTWTTFIRSSIIGAIIGAIPGLGAVAATYVSYSTASIVAKDKSSFGHGNPAGIIASEASNNAKDGGAMLPTLFFGIPGSPEHAILLAIFIIFGIEPGPGMGTEHMDLVWTIILAIALSNVIACLIVLGASKVLCRITSIPIAPVVAAALPISVAAVFVVRGNPWDLTVAAVFTVVGIMMKRTGYPIGPFIVGFVLGPLLEKSFYISLVSGLYDPLTFFHSRLSIGLAAIVGLMLLLPLVVRLRQLIVGHHKVRASPDSTTGKSPEKSAGRRDSIIFGTVLMAMALLFVGLVPSYGILKALPPLVLGIPLILLLVVLLVSEVHSGFSHLVQTILGHFGGKGQRRLEPGWGKLAPVLGWVFTFVGLMIVAGTIVANLVFTFGVLRFWGRMSWIRSTISAVAITAIIYLLFEVAFGMRLWLGVMPTLIPGVIGGGTLPPF